MGPFATGIAAIAAVMSTAGTAYLVYGDKLKDLPAVLGHIATALGNLATSLGANIIDGIRMIPNMVSAVIVEAFKSIGDMISSAVKGLVPGWLGGGTAPTAPKVEPPGDKRSSLVPPAAPVSITLNATMNLDGRRMAQVVQSHLVAAATYPTSAAGADSRGTWMGPSWNPIEQG